MDSKHTRKMLRIYILLAAIILVCFLITPVWWQALLVAQAAAIILGTFALIEIFRRP